MGLIGKYKVEPMIDYPFWILCITNAVTFVYMIMYLGRWHDRANLVCVLKRQLERQLVLNNNNLKKIEALKKELTREKS